MTTRSLPKLSVALVLCSSPRVDRAAAPRLAADIQPSFSLSTAMVDSGKRGCAGQFERGRHERHLLAG